MTSIRRSSIVAAALCALLVLGACGATSSPALTVNGSDVSDSDLRDHLDVLRDHPRFANDAYGGEIPDEGSTVDNAVVAEVLRIWVLMELVDQEVTSRGLDVADLDEMVFLSDLEPSLAELPSDAQERFRTWDAQLVALGDALEEEAAARPDEVTDADVEAFYDEYEAIFDTEEVCARHVLVETEAEAEEVLAELDGGAEFGDVAREFSTDPSAEFNEGDLGCVGRGNYVPGFEEAAWEGPIGEVQGPVESQFGFHVLLVDSRGTAGFESVAPEIQAFLESPASRDAGQLVNIVIQRLVASADVSVSSRYGTWNSDTQRIDPHEGPTTTQAGTEQ